MANGIQRILVPLEINGVVVDPANASNTQVLQFTTETGKFTPKYLPSASGTDEGTAAMLASWMMGSN